MDSRFEINDACHVARCMGLRLFIYLFVMKNRTQSTDKNKNKRKKYKLLCPRGTQTCALAVANIKVNGNGKVILDTHPESDQHQN